MSVDLFSTSRFMAPLAQTHNLSLEISAWCGSMRSVVHTHAYAYHTHTHTHTHTHSTLKHTHVHTHTPTHYQKHTSVLCAPSQREAECRHIWARIHTTISSNPNFVPTIVFFPHRVIWGLSPRKWSKPMDQCLGEHIELVVCVVFDQWVILKSAFLSACSLIRLSCPFLTSIATIAIGSRW